MPLTVTNTLTGEREDFTPHDPDTVRLYYCGLTVSDDPHLGHARSWVHVDVMRRWLEHLGYTVRHVENFTDVNEKIVARIGDPDLDDTEDGIARHYIARSLADMRALNLKRAVVYPRVSEHIPEITSLIQALIDRGYAYESNGSVYFDVTSFEAYGALSNQRIDDIEAQGDPDELAEKRHPADFALWKAGAVSPDAIAEHRPPDLDPIMEPQGLTWESPWGPGRPGWHIECSAMSMTHLDDHLDIHVGGQDLVFPHHENEIAQSEAATGESFARYWLHVRLLETEGEKMSTSLQNYFPVQNAVAAFGPNAIRTFLLSTQYSQRQSYTEAALHEAVERWERLERAYQRAQGAVDSVEARTKLVDEDLRAAVADAREEFRAGMNDDFNTRAGLRALSGLVTGVNRHVDSRDEYDYRGLRRALEAFEELADVVLGLSFDATSAGDESLAEGLVELVLSIREEERAAGNFDRADRLRADLEALGVTIEDTEDGPTYKL